MRADLLWRALFPIVAVVALLLEAPTAISGAFALVGMVLAIERLVRLRRLGLIMSVIVGLVSVLATLAVIGVVLQVTGIGADIEHWALPMVIVSGAALTLAAVIPTHAVAARDSDSGAEAREPRVSSRSRVAVLAVAWVAAAAAVVVLVVHRSGDEESTASDPAVQPLQLSLGTVAGTRVDVVVSDGVAIGPLKVTTISGGNSISYPTFSLEPGRIHVETVSLPTHGRFTIAVGYPNQSEPLRTLVMNR